MKRALPLAYLGVLAIALPSGAALCYVTLTDRHRDAGLVMGVLVVTIVLLALIPSLRRWQCRRCGQKLEESCFQFRAKDRLAVDELLARMRRGENFEAIHELASDDPSRTLVLQMWHCPTCRAAARLQLADRRAAKGSFGYELTPIGEPIIVENDAVKVLLQ